MIARFVGGSIDGQTRFVTPGARYWLVPVPLSTARPEDFLNLDYKAKVCRVDRYRRVWYDSEQNDVVYLYEVTE